MLVNLQKLHYPSYDKIENRVSKESNLKKTY